MLRKQLLLTGTKVGCGDGQCGACSVIVDGKLTRSCVTKMKRVPDGASITTIEGIGTPENLHPIQLAFIVHGAPQCGFCMPGFVVSAKALLDQNPNPTREEVRDWFHAAPQCLPLHRLQADRRRGHGRGQGAARRDAAIEALEFKMPADGKIWGGKYPRPTAVAKVTGTLDYGAGPGPQDAARHAAAGPGAGQGLARQHPVASTPPKPRRCPASSRSSPTRTSRARTASPA